MPNNPIPITAIPKDPTFIREPKQAEYGIVAVFADLYGNRWDLIEFAPDHPLAES